MKRKTEQLDTGRCPEADRAEMVPARRRDRHTSLVLALLLLPALFSGLGLVARVLGSGLETDALVLVGVLGVRTSPNPR